MTNRNTVILRYRTRFLCERIETALAINCCIITSFLISISLTLGFPLIPSLNFTGFFLINTVCGAYTYIWISKKSKHHFIELLALGIGLGTLLPAVINFAIRQSGITFGATAIAFPIIVCICRVFQQKFNSQINVVATRSEPIDLILLLSTGIIAISAWSSEISAFFLYVLLGLIGLFFILPKVKCYGRVSNAINFALIGFFPLGLLLTKLFDQASPTLPIWRKILGVDTAWDEALAFSTAKYGTHDSIMIAGQRQGTHFLTNAWAGDFAAFSHTPPYMMSVTIGFVVGVIGISALAYTISFNLFKNVNAARFSIFLIFVQASMPEEYFFLNTLRMAHAISLMWLLVFWVLLIEIYNHGSKFSLAIIIVLTFAITMAKVHWGFIATIIILILSIIEYLKQKKTILLLYAVIVTFVFLSTLKFAFPSGQGFPLNIRYSMSYLYEIVGLIVLRFVFLLRYFSNTEHRLERRIGFLSIAIAVFLHAVLTGEKSSDYLISHAFIWTSIFLGRQFESDLTSQNWKPKFWFPVAAMISGLGFWVCYYYFSNNYLMISIQAKTPASWFVVKYPELIPLFASCIIAILLLCLMSIISIRSKKSSLANMLYISFLVTAIALNCGIWFAQSQRVRIIESHYDVQLHSFVLSNEQFEASDWIRNNTNPNDIMASNFLCDAAVGYGDPFSISNDDDCLNRNTLSWLGSNGHRRVLIESPLYAATWIGSHTQTLDYNMSVEYGHKQSTAVLNYLIGRGVDYFVFDKEISHRYGLGNFKDVVFENEDYAIVRLLDS